MHRKYCVPFFSRVAAIFFSIRRAELECLAVMRRSEVGLAPGRSTAIRVPRRRLRSWPAAAVRRLRWYEALLRRRSLPHTPRSRRAGGHRATSTRSPTTTLLGRHLVAAVRRKLLQPGRAVRRRPWSHATSHLGGRHALLAVHWLLLVTLLIYWLLENLLLLHLHLHLHLHLLLLLLLLMLMMLTLVDRVLHGLAVDALLHLFSLPFSALDRADETAAWRLRALAAAASHVEEGRAGHTSNLFLLPRRQMRSSGPVV